MATNSQAKTPEILPSPVDNNSSPSPQKQKKTKKPSSPLLAADTAFSRCMELLEGVEDRHVSGGYTRRGKCLCPVHEGPGSRPSLSVAVKDGKFLAKCFAGCDQRAVWEALKELLKGKGARLVRKSSAEGEGGSARTVKKKNIQKLLDSNAAYKKEAGSWIYRDASGQPISIKKKFLIVERSVEGVSEEKILGKDYWRGHAVRGEKGEFLEWKSGVSGFVSEILYNLPVLMDAQVRGLPVVVCEGEKDCDTIYKICKLAATTNANGAGEWTEQDAETVLGLWRGQEAVKKRKLFVVVVQDNDAPGRASGLRKALWLWELAQEVGAEATIKLLPCFVGEGPDEGLDSGFDVSDWFESGMGSKEDFIQRCRRCPAFDPTELDDPEPWLRLKEERARLKGAQVAAEARAAERLVTKSFVPDRETEANGERYTDRIYTKHLVEDYSAFAGYCPGWAAWVRYVGGVWDASGGEVEGVSLVSDLSARMLEEARGRRVDPGNEQQVKKKQDAIKAALKIADMTGVSNLLKYASRTREMLKPVELFDTQVDLLNLSNGEVCLKRAALLPHEAKNYHAKQLAVPFDPNAACPKWEAFIQQTFIVKKDPSDPSQAPSNIDLEKTRELIGFVRRLCGYCLTGYVSEQRFVILQGVGSNGKSVFINTLMSLLGSGELGYAATIPVDTILKNSYGAGGGEGPTPQLAKLVGKRLVTAGELSEGDVLNDSRLKDWTGGDPITGRSLRKDPLEFKPQFKLFIRCNPLPRIPASDSALWRRIIVVPFVNLVTAEEVNPLLEQELQAELPGILRWCAEGAVEWYRVGLQIPAACTDFAEEYVGEMDWAQQFVSEVCVVQAGARTPREGIYKAYVYWSEERGEKPKSQRLFTQEMKRMGYVRETGVVRLPGATKTCRVFNGLMLDPTWGDVDDEESAKELLQK